MNRINYRITLSAKILILELLICSAGLLSGFTLNVYNENKSWDNLIYPNVEVSGIILSGKTLEEGRSLLEKQFITPLLNKKVNIIADGKTFTLDNSRIILDNNFDYIVNQSFNFGKNFTPLEKSKFLKSPTLHQQYNIAFNFNESYIKDSIKVICAEINREPLNASIYFNEDGTVEINSDSKGIKLNESKLEEDIKNNINDIYNSVISINAPVEETPAEITVDRLCNLTTKIASFSTSFSSSSIGRAHNIELSAKSINGKIIMPGESFSFNESVGERTAQRGFMEAPVIVGFAIDSGLGGGICQVSTTLYNAILRTGVNSVERTPHTLPSDYVPLGLDATVDWSNIDYKFQNTLDYPIYIQAYTENSNLNINIYSDFNLAKYEYTIMNDVYAKIQTNTRIIDNPNLEEGEIFVTQKGYPGYRVKVLRYTHENGVLINSETISDDFYSPVPNVISRGVKTIK